ncbi:MAG: UDP-N-acetylmuramoyl-L-alanyl-D-glutamate--2,6-diaminopimelate ligase [Actinomycetes bacterium]
MQLSEILVDVEVDRVIGPLNLEVRSIVDDSRRVTPGALFAAIPGSSVDGHDHAAEAVRRGAVALLVERELNSAATQIQVGSVRRSVGPVASVFEGRPSASMNLLGVTGTNGKTTVSYLLESIATAAGKSAGVIGTLGARIDGDELPVGFTTPEAADLQRLLGTMRDRGVETVALEVSSHALAQSRVDGTRFKVACFTNLTHDHIDFHGSMAEYFSAKARLFTRAFTNRAVINLDDPVGLDLETRATGAGVSVLTYGLGSNSDVTATDIEVGATGTDFTVVGRASGGESRVHINLLGRLNVSNALAALTTAFSADIPLESALEGLANLRRVPGRLERVDAGQQFAVLVDFAHTPDALATVLRDARALARGGRVIVVFGCGGDRDSLKRPLMGAAAGAHADIAIITSDNSRSENPQAIADAVELGIRSSLASYQIDLDRRRAIGVALELAGPDDVVVIAGKGHETSQTSMGVTHEFNDVEVAEEILRDMLLKGEI